MTIVELAVVRDLCGALIEARDKSDNYERKLVQAQGANEKKDKEYSSLCIELNGLRERNAMATAANEDLKNRCSDLMAERDEARRKLGALLLCVGFLKDYDAKHPARSLEAFKAAVKKCIDVNHIVMTEKGMAK